MELLAAQSFHKMYTQKYMGFHGCNGMGYATVVINEIALFQFIFCVALFEDVFAFDYVDKLISNVFIGVDKLTLFVLLTATDILSFMKPLGERTFSSRLCLFVI